MATWSTSPPDTREERRHGIKSVGFSGTPKDMGPPYGKLPILFPYHSQSRIPKEMGIVWEACHKGVPVLMVPGITIDKKETRLVVLNQRNVDQSLNLSAKKEEPSNSISNSI